MSPREKRAKDELAKVKAEYDASQNPLWVWWAYRVARECNLPCPAWVTDYFDRSAENLLALTFPPVLPTKRAIAPAIKKALGFPVDPRRTKFNPFDLGERDLAITDHVYLQIVHHERKPLYACEFAAKKFGVSRRTVERAWKKCERFVTWRSGESRWRTAVQETSMKTRHRALATK